ncbi:hypothetical protein Q31a_05180 [Aureliella helgolandensis]|uniref:Uncharacterized protein n=1 Tax=Aureliella helgolandensis TaxID=2527968 RepID=A0A518G136_9BACT|nr:hypothetical protein Q31a_05180 [Aureliella helgolandensis]
MTTVGPKLLALAIQAREQSDARQSATFSQIYHQINLADGVIGTVVPLNSSHRESLIRCHETDAGRTTR